jgi:hypothetical protein
MSAMFSSMIALENCQNVQNLPLSLSFDGQMWLGNKHSLRATLQYYNTYNVTLPEMRTFFA